MERYTSAERKLTEVKNLDDIRKELAQATTHFQEANQAIALYPGASTS